jgi:proteasome lid subunit RPN8/RPN11
MSEMDLISGTVPTKVERPSRPPLKWLWFEQRLFAKMLASFTEASPKESICWGTGPAVEFEGGVLGWIQRFWPCDLEYASRVGAQTKTEWMLGFVEKLLKEEPDHKVVVETHSHPIGAELSGIDVNGLLALNDWSRDIYWVMVACDFELGVHVVNENSNATRRIPWGVDGIWVERKPEENSKSGLKTSSTTFVFNRASGVLQRLRRQPSSS